MTHYHNTHIDLLHQRELSEIYISNAIRAFALSLIGIFVPIYLYNQGYSISQILLFFALVSIFHIAFTLPAAKLASKIGFKHLIIASMPIYIGFFTLLYTIPEYHWPVMWLALFLGAKGALFWLGYHVHFTRNATNESQQIGAARITTSMAAALGPALGGIIVSYAGFDRLILLTLALLSFTAVPFMCSTDTITPLRVNKRGLVSLMRSNALGYLAKGAEAGIGSVVWPLFIYLGVVGSYETLGFIHTISLIAGIAFTYLIAKVASTHKLAVFRIAAVLNGIVWLLRSLVTLPFHIYITDSLYGMTQTAIFVPFTAITYDRAREHEVVHGIIAREITINIGKASALLLLSYASSLYAGLFIGSATSFLLLAL